MRDSFSNISTVAFTGTIRVLPPVITTYAGSDWVFPGDGKRALDAPLGWVKDVVLDKDWNPIIVDLYNCIVARIEKTGVLTVLAGNGLCQVGVSSGSGGDPLNAALDSPSALAYAPNGDIYVKTASSICRISQGTIMTVVSFPRDGNGPEGNMVVDAAKNIFFADVWHHQILKYTPADPQASSYEMTVYAGQTDQRGYSGDGGAATEAKLYHPHGVTLDAGGTLYIADWLNDRIRKVTPGGIISTVMALPTPRAVKFDSRGTMYVTATNCVVYRVTPGSTAPTLIGGADGRCGYAGDNIAAASVSFSDSLYLDIDPLGNIYLADDHYLRKISPDGIVTNLAGNGRYRTSPDGTSRFDSFLDSPVSMAVEPNPEFRLYFGEGDTKSYKVRKIVRDEVSRVAGTGERGPTPDVGPALTFTIGNPKGLAFDFAANLYVAGFDSFCSCIHKVTPQGVMSKFSKDRLIGPQGLAVGPNGNLFAAVAGVGGTSHVDQFVPQGQVSRFAGDDSYSYGGDGGPAVKAQVWWPQAVAVDPFGSVYIGGFLRVRKVTPDGIISTFAGGGNDFRDGIPATQAALGQVAGLAFDRAGNLLISDSLTNKIRIVSSDGIITTVAGGGPADQLGDGKVATSATLNKPAGLAVDALGNIYIADRDHHRVREVLATPPSIQVSPAVINFSAPSGGAVVTQTIAVTGDFPGLEFSVSTSSGADWLTVSQGPFGTPRLITVTADPSKLSASDYTATITIKPAAATPASLAVDVRFHVGSPQDAILAIDKTELSFTAPKGAVAAVQPLVISNQGGGTLSYTALVSTTSGGNWLTVSAASGQASPGKPSTLNITAQSSGLNPGTYVGAVTILSATSKPPPIPVILTVSSNPQAIALTQTGMSFTAVVNGGIIPPQSFGVQNLGTGVMNWNASTSTTKGPVWVRVSPNSGSTTAGATVPEVTVTVDPTGLAAGKYYGTVRVDAPTTANKAAVVTIFLEVLAAGTPVAAAVQPPELVFQTTPGGLPPGSQILTLYNIAATPRSFTSQRAGNFQLLALPGNGSLDPQQPTRIVVQPILPIPLATTTGALTFQFSDGTVQSVKITMVSSTTASSAASSQDPNARGAAAACSPTELKVSLKSFASSFKAPAGWPVALNVNVTDDCGQPLVGSSGSSVVVHVDGEDDVVMDALGEGTWQGTWKPLKVNPNATVHIDARRGAVTGQTTLTGSLGTLNEQPVFTYESVLSVFAAAKGVRPLAPGAFVSIYAASDAQLADSTEKADDSRPLELKLGNTQVYFNDTRAPISFASPRQLNVKVPWDVFRNTRNYIRIKNGDAWSTPIYVDIADAQPTPYAPIELNGNLWALDFPANGAAFVVSESAPARAGDLVQIYAVGLGAASQTLGDQDLSPTEPLAVVPDYSVNVGGAKAELEFAGLTPGLSGLYQVHFYVPATTQSGNVPVTITVGGQTSPAVNLPVR